MKLLSSGTRRRTRERQQSTLLTQFASVTSGSLNMESIKNIIRTNSIKPSLTSITKYPINATIQPVIIIQD